MQNEQITLIQRMRLFQKVAVGVLLFFGAIMVVVTYIAFNRKSGSTGLDMTQVQKIRYEKRPSP